MKTILVSYDLRGHEDSSEYARLIKEIKAYGDVIRPLYSLWLLRTDWTAEQVRNDLQRFVDDDDRLLVWDVTGRAAAWKRLSDEHSTWIRSTP